MRRSSDERSNPAALNAASEQSVRKLPRRRIGPIGKIAVVLALTSLLSLGVGYFAGTFVKSPAQVAAEASPPPPTQITAVVQTGVLHTSLILAGKVSLGDQIELSPPPPAGVSAVVTGLPKSIGEQAGPGSVLLEVGDRPLILLPGSIPLIRDLRVGDEGPDVSRLQDALRACGQTIGDRAGRFGWSTATALAAIYKNAGYAPPKAGGGPASALQSELMFAPGTAARIVALGGAIGQVVKNPAVTLTTTPAIVTAVVPPATAAQLQVGAPVMISGDIPGGSSAGTITSIGVPIESEEGSGFQVTIRVTPEADLGTGAEDREVQVNIDLTQDESLGLIVPVSAIHAEASGLTSVVVLAGSRETAVTVAVLATADGKARVVATEGNLSAGDRVLIGAS